MRKIIATCKDKPPFVHQKKPFKYLCRSIVSQQLAGAAARTIYGRFEAKCGRVTPENVLALTTPQLRSCGLSRQKLSYLRDLAKHVLDERLDIHKMNRLTDERIIEELTAVKGIGVWTAQMFLMFNLGRLDVFPVTDLGIRNGMRELYRLREPVTNAKLERIAQKWAPYRSIGSWYVWHWKDNGVK